MFAVLLPIKDFRHSKQRLSSWLDPGERVSLAHAMFEDVWTTLQSSRFWDRLFVVSSEPFVVERCRQQGVTCRAETAQRSHSESVMEATQWVMNHGVTSLLSIPIDTPAITPEDISSLAELAPNYAVVVAPSGDGTGTNALLRTPPNAISPQFGPGSCRLHVEQAKSSALPYLVRRVDSLAADIDTLEDAERFLVLNHPCRTSSLLRRLLDSRRTIRPGVAVCS